jgi:hypothetical protein
MADERRETASELLSRGYAKRAKGSRAAAAVEKARRDRRRAAEQLRVSRELRLKRRNKTRGNKTAKRGRKR